MPKKGRVLPDTEARVKQDPAAETFSDGIEPSGSRKGALHERIKHVVGVADTKICATPGELIVTHALGSCLGIAIHDPVAQVGGILHVTLPLSFMAPDKAKANPYMFVDTGLPRFFREAYAAGAVKERLVVKVAGGANLSNDCSDRFAIGKRNRVVLRKLFWKNGILVDAEDTGGNGPRTMYLEVGSGAVWLTVARKRKDL